MTQLASPRPRYAWIIFFFKAVCSLQEPHASHLGPECNCTGLINSFSFPSKVEAGARGYKLNANPLWARILWAIKTKSAAAAAPHQTLRSRAEPAASQPAGWGAPRAQNVPARSCPTPAGGQVEGGQGQNPPVRAGSRAAAWRNSRGHTRPAPGARREWRPRQKSSRTKPIAPAGTGRRAPPTEWGWEGRENAGGGGEE